LKRFVRGWIVVGEFAVQRNLLIVNDDRDDAGCDLLCDSFARTE
jgi:hypothetical protein